MTLEKKGLFFVFEGIDGAGTSTHVHRLAERIEQHNKYQDVLKTHEPWKSAEIKKRLEEDSDAYSNAYEMADLYVDDRAKHSYRLIRPNLEAGVVVICSRYKMSTCAYQWVQGMDLHELLQMHKERGIITPDLTFFLDVPPEIAQERIASRKAKEKFEDIEFAKRLVDSYNALRALSKFDERIFGKVVRIDGNREVEEVSDDIFEEFLSVYQQK
ncbi:MAG: dTMP kinase [Nanoarchaeota archaeon]